MTAQAKVGIVLIASVLALTIFGSASTRRFLNAIRPRTWTIYYDR